MFYAHEYKYDKFFTTDASPRIFDMIGFFNMHGSISEAIWNLAGKLDRQKYFDLMREERAMELMELVKEEVYRI
jgi:xylose isomerase